MYATGKKYFVAKNPAFSPKIATLMEFFPDARIIYLVRNPLDMLPSTISMDQLRSPRLHRAKGKMALSG